MGLQKYIFSGLCTVLLAVPFAASAEDFLSEEQLQRAYEQAMERFSKGGAAVAVPEAAQHTDGPDTAKDNKPDAQHASDDDKAQEHRTTGEVKIGLRDRSPFHKGSGMPLEYVSLPDLRVSINVENVPLEDVMKMILDQAQESTGPWSVKWRLSEDNKGIMNERVNLTAETTFDQFMTYLVDRVNNMTGTRLFVRLFDEARIILITDTY
ncbi:MAG: hypothetical protein GC134_08790 [Proteobacteria bacterium]|nr:hypothetical protein [Pseudomonadota bacterium]